MDFLCEEVKKLVDEFNSLAAPVAVYTDYTDCMDVKRKMYDRLANIDSETWKDFKKMCEQTPGVFDINVKEILRWYYYSENEDTYSRLREVALILAPEIFSTTELS